MDMSPFFVLGIDNCKDATCKAWTTFSWLSRTWSTSFNPVASDEMGRMMEKVTRVMRVMVEKVLGVMVTKFMKLNNQLTTNIIKQVVWQKSPDVRRTITFILTYS